MLWSRRFKSSPSSSWSSRPKSADALASGKARGNKLPTPTAPAIAARCRKVLRVLPCGCSGTPRTKRVFSSEVIRFLSSSVFLGNRNKGGATRDLPGGLLPPRVRRVLRIGLRGRQQRLAFRTHVGWPHACGTVTFQKEYAEGWEVGWTRFCKKIVNWRREGPWGRSAGARHRRVQRSPQRLLVLCSRGLVRTKGHARNLRTGKCPR